MYHMKTLAVATAVAITVLACSDQPTAPADQVDIDLIAMDDFGFTYGSGPGLGCATGPGTCFGTGTYANRSYLGTLVQEAYQKVLTTQGAAAAEAAFTNLWTLHQDAFALRTTDHTAFVTAMQAVHLEAARLVVDVLGAGTAATAIDLAQEKLDALHKLIADQQAAGVTTSRLEYLASRVDTYLADARSRLAAGDAVGALDLATRALQAATMGAGQNARQGPRGTGGGAQNHGGR